MRREYNFLQSKKNPYAKHLKKQITINLDEPIVLYFKELSKETGISYQNLINLFLKECTIHEKKPSIKWLKAA